MLYIITLICGLCNKVSSVLAGKLCTAVRLTIEIITEYSYVINIMNNKINLDHNPINRAAKPVKVEIALLCVENSHDL